ncbi:MAG: hypothetical protein R3C11_06905 [Planctomycetaceae bacterium]
MSSAGDVVECWPAYEEFSYRIELWGDEIEKLSIINPTSGEELKTEQEIFIYPAKHFVLPRIELMGRSKKLKMNYRYSWKNSAMKANCWRHSVWPREHVTTLS